LATGPQGAGHLRQDRRPIRHQVQQPDRHGLLDRGGVDGQVRGVGNRDDGT
jgi:hypothetical protein